MRMRLWLFLMAWLCTVGGGCKSAIEKQFEAEQATISTPLEHDPTEKSPLAQWWANRSRLLHLEENAAYALYEGNNRYTTPIETGRWTKQSYAVMWLEPYNTIHVEPRRVGITKVGGRLALLLPNSDEPLFALKRAPVVLEDRLVGAWEGPLGELQLMENMRYALSPKMDKVSAGAPQIYAMRKGSWKIIGKQLVLLSDIPGVDPLQLPLAVDEKAITIAAPGGALNKSQPLSSAVAAEQSQPPTTK